MRRMYSEQELTKIIQEVMSQYIEAGAFDSKIKEYAEDWLEENPLEPSDLDFSNIDFVAKTLTQTEANYQKSFNSASITAYLTPTTIYNKFEVLNNILYLVISMYNTENAGETHSNVSECVVSYSGEQVIDSDIADKIYDINGDKVSDAIAQNTIIAVLPAKVQVVGVGTMDANLNIYNSTSANTIIVNVIANNISIPANGTIRVYARAFLTLL